MLRRFLLWSPEAKAWRVLALQAGDRRCQWRVILAFVRKFFTLEWNWTKTRHCHAYLNFDGRCITYRDGSWAALGHGLSWATDLNFRLREGHRHPAKVFEDFCCQELLPLVWQRVGRSHLLIPDVTLPFCLDMTWTHMFNFFHYRLSSILKVTNKVWRAIKKLQRQNMTK